MLIKENIVSVSDEDIKFYNTDSECIVWSPYWPLAFWRFLWEQASTYVSIYCETDALNLYILVLDIKSEQSIYTLSFLLITKIIKMEILQKIKQMKGKGASELMFFELQSFRVTPNLFVILCFRLKK
jgi:hypothetical protein